MARISRRILFVLLAIMVVFFFKEEIPTGNLRPEYSDGLVPTKLSWAKVTQHYPVTSFKSLPEGKSEKLPRIQHIFAEETDEEKSIRLARLAAVKGNFTHAWNGYKSYAWQHDEVRPLSGGAADPFGGWAATLVDSLDTLWIMGLHDEFNDALHALKHIDFSTCTLEKLNVFETTIRHLGGLLAAYDLTDGKYDILLKKAKDFGDMLYKAFDTPNRLPITRWNFRAAASGVKQEADTSVIVSELGSLTLEFTRLSQITSDMKYFDAVQRIMDVFEEQQNKTKLPGMWPIVVDAKNSDFTGYGGFTIGGMEDSLYEYLPKQHILLGGATEQYSKLYDLAMLPIRRNIFYRPMTQNGEDIRFAGQVFSNGQTPVDNLKTDAQAQHLGCFAGGMVAIAAKIFENGDLELAKKLVNGCLWAYETMPLGIMPEIMHTVRCEDELNCPWDEAAWHARVNEENEGTEDVSTKIAQHGLSPGVTKVDDTRYILRPEAIESVFILYRITGDPTLQDRAWKMFENIIRHTKTDIAHAALADCTVPKPAKMDSMESFWLAETLKYFYLIFAEPDLISLDEFVLNTEAHPLRRPTG
ncbi:putative endoplasmic reticulum mannosyl-oligosaccharide 1,2-alpha-mannosidase [Xylogone sp. PMI_703]|nr:putative endoplasmic reticulum mannosyl-oligosaccharide 1,2-alpha-mannosidase [Xylogone sp. PMI_703]